MGRTNLAQIKIKTLYIASSIYELDRDCYALILLQGDTEFGRQRDIDELLIKPDGGCLIYLSHLKKLSLLQKLSLSNLLKFPVTISFTMC